MLQTHAPACDILQLTWYICRHHFHFDAFSTIYTYTICIHFCFDLLSRAFSNRGVFDRTLSVLVWTGKALIVSTTTIKQHLIPHSSDTTVITLSVH